MHDRHARQTFLGANSDNVLGDARVAIVGLGGGGSHIVQQLAHIGIGSYVLLDPDIVDETNLNRLVGGTSKDAARSIPKIDIGARVIKSIRANAEIQAFQSKWQKQANFLRDCEIIVGCVDSFAEREQLEIAARRYHTPYLDLGMDVHRIGDEFVIAGQVVLSMPGELCLRCLGVITDDLLAREAGEYGAAGPRPQVVWPNGVLASAAVGLIVQLLTPWHENSTSTAYLEYDGNQHTLTTSNRLLAMRGARCAHHNSIDDLGDPFWKPQATVPSHSTASWWQRLLNKPGRK